MQPVGVTLNPDLKHDAAVALRYYKRLERLFLTLDKYGDAIPDVTLAKHKSEIGRRQRELQRYGYTVPVTIAQAQALVVHFGGSPDIRAM